MEQFLPNGEMCEACFHLYCASTSICSIVKNVGTGYPPQGGYFYPPEWRVLGDEDALQRENSHLMVEWAKQKEYELHRVKTYGDVGVRYECVHMGARWCGTGKHCSSCRG